MSADETPVDPREVDEDDKHLDMAGRQKKTGDPAADALAEHWKDLENQK